ncbi:MAG: FAD-dependent oxidoreductase [Ferruginibacter sp.]
MTNSRETVIIGGGIIGLCCAWYLQKEGFTVTVIDKEDISNNCSFGNMGYFSPSHFIPLASPGIVAEGLRYILNSSSPFYIKPRMNADLIRWSWHFIRSSNARTVEQHAPHLNNLLQLSRNLLTDLKNETGNHFSMEEKGCFMLCNTVKALEHEFQLADEAEKFGLKVERLDAAQTQALEPDVELKVAGAVLFKDDCHVHPGELMHTLKKQLEQKGVKFLLNHTVSGFEKSGSSVNAVITDKGKIASSQVVVAAGSWLPQIAKLLGLPLLLQPGKGYSYTYPQVEKNILYPAILVEGRCAITPWQHRLRIGGTMELSGINHKVLAKRMQGIYKSVKLFYPGLKVEEPPQNEIWCGLRPVTPDGLPYIGKAKNLENVIFAAGHAMLGISQCTGTGLLVSQLAQNKKPEIAMGNFAVERF